MEVLAYRRVSNANAIKSFEYQKQIIIEYCKKNDLKVIGGNKDTCTAYTLDRPGLQKLLKRRRKKDIKGIVVYSVDRLSRSGKDLNYLINLANEEGFTWFFADENLSSTDKDFCEKILPYIQYAEFEPIKMSKRIKSSFDNKKAKDEKLGGNPEYGFDSINGKYYPNFYELKVILFIVKLRFKYKLSYGKISTRLNKKNIPSKMGKIWSDSTVRNIYNRWKRIYKASSELL